MWHWNPLIFNKALQSNSDNIQWDMGTNKYVLKIRNYVFFNEVGNKSKKIKDLRYFFVTHKNNFS